MIKHIFKLLLILSLPSLSVELSAKEYPVAITPDVNFVDIKHQKTKVRIKRIQDETNKLVDDFAKTSRACPPFCIHPMKAAKGVETIGEIELLEFLKKEVATGTGLLIDARMPRFFQSETIPGSVNIPFLLFSSPNKADLLTLLGAKPNEKGFDFSQSKNLVLYCNGPWCDQSPRAIKALIKAGYPASKLKYYRGGMQLWKIFSLTTVVPRKNIVNSRDNRN